MRIGLVGNQIARLDEGVTRRFQLAGLKLIDAEIEQLQRVGCVVGLRRQRQEQQRERDFTAGPHAGAR